ncbi:unnamed protein product, partial [Discosporangium mesarthrocarpum]
MNTFFGHFGVLWQKKLRSPFSDSGVVGLPFRISSSFTEGHPQLGEAHFWNNTACKRIAYTHPNMPMYSHACIYVMLICIHPYLCECICTQMYVRTPHIVQLQNE